jgi:hypothetical protein
LAPASLTVAASSAAALSPVEELRDLSLEDLANLQITSVSKRSEALSKAAPRFRHYRRGYPPFRRKQPPRGAAACAQS